MQVELSAFALLGGAHPRFGDASELEQSVLEGFVLRDASRAFGFEQPQRSTGEPRSASMAVDSVRVLLNRFELVRCVDFISGAEIVSSFLVTDVAVALVVKLAVEQVSVVAEVGESHSACLLDGLGVVCLDFMDLSFPNHLFGKRAEWDDSAVGRASCLLLAKQAPTDLDNGQRAGSRRPPNGLSGGKRAVGMRRGRTREVSRGAASRVTLTVNSRPHGFLAPRVVFAVGAVVLLLLPEHAKVLQVEMVDLNPRLVLGGGGSNVGLLRSLGCATLHAVVNAAVFTLVGGLAGGFTFALDLGCVLGTEQAVQFAVRFRFGWCFLGLASNCLHRLLVGAGGADLAGFR